VAGFGLPFAIAAKMHVGHLTDAYAFTLGVAVFASALFAGVLQTNVLPILQRMKRLGRAAFVGRVRRISGQAAGIAVVSYAAIGVVSIAYIDRQSHWTLQQHQFVVAATALFAMFVVAVSVNSVLAAGLNALDQFLTPAATQAFRSVAPLVALPFVARSAGGLLAVAALVSGGELFRTAVLLWQVRRAVAGLPQRPAPEGYAAELSLGRVAAPTAFAMMIAAASPLIDRAVAAPLSQGSVTLLDLGEKVFQAPLTVLSSSFVLVAGTHWADIGRSDVAGLRRHVRRTMTRGSVVCLVLLAVILLAVGIAGTIIGPRFATASTNRLLAIVALLLVGLPAAFVMSAGARFLTSTRSTYLLPAFAVCSFTTNLVFDIAGAHVLGVEGIALSSTIYRCVNAVLYVVVMRRLMVTGFRGLRIRA
jgi:peptidoglycan biosynthesis protein MviN/MurJ (putative lipid II flippase)